MKKWKKTKRQRNYKRHKHFTAKIQLEKATYKYLKKWSLRTCISIEKLIDRCFNYYTHNKNKFKEEV